MAVAASATAKTDRFISCLSFYVDCRSALER
jgi:hypothetical protein